MLLVEIGVGVTATLLFLCDKGWCFEWACSTYREYPSLHAWAPKLSSVNGLGSLSFTSVVTGLNLALVKFEAFRKTIKDVKEHWEEEARIVVRNNPALRADDDYRDKLCKALNGACDGKLQECLDQYQAHGASWRQMAIRMSVLGFLALFANYSIGILGSIALSPALGWYWSRTRIEKDYKRKLKDLTDLTEQMQSVQSDRKDGINSALQSAKQSVEGLRELRAKTVAKSAKSATRRSRGVGKRQQ